MNICSLLAVYASIIYLILGAFAIRVDRKATVNRIFALLCALFAIWVFGYIFIYSSSDYAECWAWYRFSALGWCLFPGAMWHYWGVFSKSGRFSGPWHGLFYLPGFFFYFQVWFGQVLITGFTSSPLGTAELPAPLSIWYWGYLLYFSSACVYGIGQALLLAVKTSSLRERRLSIWIAVCSFLGTLFGGITNLVFPYYHFYVVPSIGAILLVFWALGIWFAILRFRFMTLTSSIAAEEILSSIDDLLVLIDKHGKILRANLRFTELIGLREEALLGRSFYLLLLDENALSEDVLRKNPNQEVTVRSNGGAIPIAMAASEIRDRDGDPLGWVITGHDLRPTLQLKHEILERQKAQEALSRLNEELEARIIQRTSDLQASNQDLAREIVERQKMASELKSSEQRMRQITDNMLDMVCLTDTDLVFRYASPSYQTILGYAPEALLGRSVLEFLHPDDSPAVEMAIAHAREYFTPGKAEFRYRHADGHYVWIESYGTAIFDEKHQLAGAVFVNRDVSQRRRDEEEKNRLQQMQVEALQQSDRLKDEFLSVISHELRTPLNSITGFASLLEDGVAGELNERQQSFVEKIMNGADRMLRLVEDLLDVARIQAGKFEISAQEVFYPSLVEEAMLALSPLAVEKRINLVTEVEPALNVVMDPQKIYQVLVNLLSNAIKFTPEGGVVSVMVRSEGERLVTEVIDSGIGLDARDIPKLFVAFRQLDMSITRKVGGTGLGLSICRAIIDAHGGLIEAESPGLNSGSTFRFVLPLNPVHGQKTTLCSNER